MAIHYIIYMTCASTKDGSIVFILRFWDTVQVIFLCLLKRTKIKICGESQQNLNSNTTLGGWPDDPSLLLDRPALILRLHFHYDLDALTAFKIVWACHILFLRVSSLLFWNVFTKVTYICFLALDCCCWKQYWTNERGILVKLVMRPI